MLVLCGKDLLSSRIWPIRYVNRGVPRGWLRIELGRPDVSNSGNNGFTVNSGGGFCEDWTISERNELIVFENKPKFYIPKFHIWKLCFNFLGDSKSQRESNWLHWFKSYRNFAERRDFPSGVVASQQACLYIINRVGVAGAVLQTLS